MKRFLFGLVVGAALCAPPVFALRIARPPEFHEWNSNTFSQINDSLLQIWNVLNGRYQLDVVTTTPKNVRKGSKGEAVLFDTGTDQYCINVGGTITSWSCTNLTAL